MANCNSSFKEFLDKVRLSSSKRTHLVSGRDALRKRIKEKFKDNERTEPKFFQQGSFSTNTIINPIDDEYDIDDGVYLQHLSASKSEWPKTETVHSWIVESIDGHTKEPPVSKKKCIRAVYAGDYHIDLPIYAEENGKFFLAVKGEDQWCESDPKSFKDWFYNHLRDSSEQLRSIILLMKAWADYNNVRGLTGISITVLVCECFQSSPDRHDISFVETAKEIRRKLKKDRRVIMPVAPFDDLLGSLSEQRVQRILDDIDTLVGSGQEALNVASEESAVAAWTGLLGDRFPQSKEKTDSVASAPLVIKTPPRPYYA